MLLRVELYGVPRARAGAAAVTLEFAGEQVRLGEVLARLAEEHPEVAEECCEPTHGLATLRPSYLASVDGRRFVRDPQVELREGESLWILSADGGGV